MHLCYNRGVGAVEEMGGCSGDLSVAATASIRLVSYPPNISYTNSLALHSDSILICYILPTYLHWILVAGLRSLAETESLQCTMCILGTTMALWSKAEIQKYTF